jgi:hypothetical protein
MVTSPLTRPGRAPYQGPSYIVARAKGLQGGWDQSTKRRLSANRGYGHTSTLDRNIPFVRVWALVFYTFRTAPVGSTPVSR